MLTYARRCLGGAKATLARRLQARRPRTTNPRGAQFTCFTSTKVQILTQKTAKWAARAVPGARRAQQRDPQSRARQSRRKRAAPRARRPRRHSLYLLYQYQSTNTDAAAAAAAAAAASKWQREQGAAEQARALNVGHLQELVRIYIMLGKMAQTRKEAVDNLVVAQVLSLLALLVQRCALGHLRSSRVQIPTAGCCAALSHAHVSRYVCLYIYVRICVCPHTAVAKYKY